MYKGGKQIMLKIILNSLECEQYLNGMRFVESTGAHFNRMKQQEWFKDELVGEIINQIDGAHVELGFSVVNNRTGAGYSVNDLSGGAKFLILVQCMRDRVFLATMGDNCCDLLEKIAINYEKDGKDLIIVSDYIHKFNFKYIKEIEYVNYNRVCHNWDELSKVYDMFLEDTEKYRKEEV